MKTFLAFIVIMVFSFCFFHDAKADDLIQPPWRGQPRTTFQQWTFDFDDSNPAFPDVINNSYGDAIAQMYVVYPAGAGWVDYLLRRLGVWGDLEAVDININNVDDIYGRKEVWIQVTYYTPPSDEPVINIPGGTYIDGEDIQIEYDGLGSWMLRREKWEIIPNPAEENINITTNPVWGMTIDQIVVDTACFPEKPVIVDVFRNSTKNMEITWSSHTDYTYAIEASTSDYDYNEVNMTWAWVATGITGNATTTSWQDSNMPMTGAKYYRIYAEGPEPQKADDTVGLMMIFVNTGRNMVSSMFEPYPVGGGTPGLSTLDKIIGDQLTGHSFNKNNSDVIEIWQNATAQYKRAWFDSSPLPGTWLDWDTGAAAGFGMDADKGYWFNIITGHIAKNVMFCGRVSKTGRSIPIAVGRNLVGSCFPVGRSLANSGLMESGFTGHSFNKNNSDTVEFWNNTTASYQRYWFDSSPLPGTWQPWDVGQPMRDIAVGDGIWVNVITGHSAFTWNYPVSSMP